MSDSLAVTFCIVTPMFLGGADQSPSDGIRPPSVKGALRFWWRALNWGRLRQTPGAGDASALRALHAEEARLFGLAADDKGGGGQGCFLLAVQHNIIRPESSGIHPFTGKAYLAGLGLGERTALPAGKNFEVLLRFRPGTDSRVIQSMEDALRVFGLVGGLGSRSRRGFGSITRLVREGEITRLPTQAELEAECNWLKSKFQCGTLSPFSAIDASTRLCRSNADFASADAALEDIGKVMNRYRTSGTSSIPDRPAPPAGERYIAGGGTVPIAALNFFRTDHNNVHSIAAAGAIAGRPSVPPQRSILGLPHPYLFSSLNRTKVVFDHMPGREKGRRASPLLVHVALYRNGQDQPQYRPILLLLESTFLPPRSQLSVSVNGRPVGNVPAPTDYTPIRLFLSQHFSAC